MVSSPIDGDLAVEKIFLDFLGSRTTFDDCCRLSKLVDGLDSQGLLAADRLAIWIYTSHFSNWYAQINRELWGGAPSIAVSNFARILDSALRKLPLYSGVTFRGYDVSSSDLSKYDPPGKVIIWLGFTSSTTDEDQIYPGNTLFTIHSQNGRVVGDYADDTSEMEVTFTQGTKFHVLGFERRGAKLVIEIEEVADAK